MKRYFNSLFFVALLFLSSCEDSQKYADVPVRYVSVDEIETFDLTALSDSVTIMPLETTDANCQRRGKIESGIGEKSKGRFDYP